MKRYDLYVGTGFSVMDKIIPDKEGEWVRYEDVAAEIERLQAIVDRQENIIRAIVFILHDYKMSCEKEQTND